MNDFLTLKGGEVDVGGAPEVISVLPFGHVVSQKGEFDVDEESLAAMKEQIAQRGVDLVVDYEHQTLTGERAPAAGWVKELFAEDGHIKARVEWTIPAKQYLENKEYRYLSPVITVRKSDNKATGLHSLALTNTPAIAGMTPIVNSSTFQGGETNMNELIKKLAAALGLGEDADEEQILTALSACVEENKALKEAAEGGKTPGKKPGEDGKPGQGGFRRMVPGAGDTCAAARTRNPSGLCRMRISGHGRPHRILLRKLLQRSCRGLVKTSCGDPSSMITPSASTSTLSATSRIKDISWLTTTIVMPCFARSIMTSRTSPIISGSRALVGSSKSMTSGRMASARAMATRCCCPPESMSG